MYLKALKIENFRNYGLEELEFDQEANIFYGLNAQGKSNLVEAICYLGLASSFRNASESELIRWGEQYFFLQAQVCNANHNMMRITAAANRKKQRRWTLNWEAKKRLSDVIGILHVVIFAPEDVQLVKQGPEARRRYLNQQMSQLDREYCRLLIRYNHILRQRNACLKQKDQLDMDQLAVWSSELARTGAYISLARAQVLSKLAPLAAQAHAELSPNENLHLQYQCSAFGRKQDFPRTLAQAEQAFLEELQRLQSAELLRGLTLAGPHRDDFSLTINTWAARSFASQGQQRTAALALKIAELELAKQERKEYPLLLLDDVFSELDNLRRERILSLAQGKAQTFITTTEHNFDLLQGKKWRINQGSIIAPQA